MAQETIDLAIIGGGAAGYTAAIYAARASMSVARFEQAMPGGQITTTDECGNDHRRGAVRAKFRVK